MQSISLYILSDGDVFECSHYGLQFQNKTSYWSMIKKQRLENIMHVLYFQYDVICAILPFLEGYMYGYH